MTELFDRYWSLRVKSDDFDYTIRPDQYGNSLRISFDINASDNIRYYSGTINVYNLEPTKRKQLAFNLLLDKIGQGAGVELKAGYKERNGLIFNGAVHRGYTVRQPETGDWITKLFVSKALDPVKEITIDQQKITNYATLYAFLSKTIDTLFSQVNTIGITKGLNFDAQLKQALEDFFNAGNTINDQLGYNGAVIQIIDEIQVRFGLKLFADHNGYNVISTKLNDFLTISTVPEKIINKTNGLIGSPTYTDTGAKLLTYLDPEYRMFQWLKLESDVINRDISIFSLRHRGDSYTNEWYSEIDASSVNQEKP